MTPADKRVALVLAGVALVGVGVLLMRRKTILTPAQFFGPRVFHRQRAAGADRRLIAFLDWWEKNGAFPIVVAPDGGVRTDEAAQKRLFDTGKSNAATLAQTPHGRAGALDIYRVLKSSGNQVLQIAVDDKESFRVVGEAAERQGLVWGGRWTSLYDGPHIEVPNWKSLPFPPAANGGVVVA